MTLFLENIAKLYVGGIFIKFVVDDILIYFDLRRKVSGRKCIDVFC